jgi:hypothetical protein
MLERPHQDPISSTSPGRPVVSVTIVDKAQSWSIGVHPGTLATIFSMSVIRGVV